MKSRAAWQAELAEGFETVRVDGDDEPLWQRTEGGIIIPRRPPRKLRGVDLFCGCGGFSIGMQEAGINMVAAVECWPDAIMTYLINLGSYDGCALGYVTEADHEAFAKKLKKAKETTSSGWIGRHNPRRDGSGCRAMVVGDATQVTGDLIRSTLAAIGDPGNVDVVVGGPPCQGMSKAGKQRKDDPRNNLVIEFVRIADELGAEVFVMENVPPLVTEQKYRPLFDAVVERAKAAGFTVTATVLDAVHYGVPQFRRRAFVVGTRGEASRRPFGFPLPTNWNFVARPGEPARRGRIHGGRWVKDPSKAEFDVEVDEVDEDDAQLELLPTRSP